MALISARRLWRELYRRCGSGSPNSGGRSIAWFSEFRGPIDGVLSEFREPIHSSASTSAPCDRSLRMSIRRALPRRCAVDRPPESSSSRRWCQYLRIASERTDRQTVRIQKPSLTTAYARREGAAADAARRRLQMGSLSCERAGDIACHPNPGLDERIGQCREDLPETADAFTACSSSAH